DCTGLRDTLLESQLFGHVKGAFTGADSATLGFFRSADGGTLFLDEIGELDLKTQAKLLRCIQERCVVPLGSVHPVPVNVRVLCATHRDLRAMVARGDFREDLFFRLDVVKIVVPSMHERPDDAPLLANHFLQQLAELYEEPAKQLSPEAELLLTSYSWPGNVRELGNAVEHAVVFSAGETLTPADFPERLRAGAIAAANLSATTLSLVDGPIVSLEAAEKALIARALRFTKGNQSAAAQILRIDRRRLHRKVERYSLVHLLSATDDGADASAPLES
ncbi:MAG: sigma 54-interacting transcriptional regulator, partial [Thermoleophilia bacterium]|nr:sigma 54-interacting transcriptional regulator [Thermoleophilia bacterium]